MADPFKDGLDAYNSGDYVTALRLWRPLTEQGDARAQNKLGLMYFNGQGVPQDHAEAAKWYRLAAEQGLAEAQYNLGVMHRVGPGLRTRLLSSGSGSPSWRLRSSLTPFPMVDGTIPLARCTSAMPP